VIIGDVRGIGLAMEQAAGEVGRAIAPHLGQEDFVTAALAQITPAAS
jgi:hypothetical protein